MWNAFWLTFDGIRHIFATDVYGNQTAHIIFHLPFVIDNIFQFDFWTTVIMFSCATVNYYIVCICFVRMQFVTAFKYTVWNASEKQQKLLIRQSTKQTQTHTHK